MDSENVHSNLRVESFSCYLNSAEQNFALNLTRGISNSSSTVISPVDTPPLINLGTSMNNEAETSHVFHADKYYNMKQEYAYASKYGLEKERSVELHQPDQNFRPKTSTITSEPSSLNCQSALLRLLCRKPSQRKHKKGRCTRLFPIFGCEGPFVSCVGKKAVSINKRVLDPGLGVLHGIQQSQPGSKKVEQLTVPVLNSGIEIVKVKEHFEGEKIVQDDPRNSIEVFGSVMTQKGDIAVNMERKLSVLRWDAIPKSQSLVTTTFGSSTMCDDMASDASSDLFEIENISGTGYPVLSRQESCNMPSGMSPQHSMRRARPTLNGVLSQPAVLQIFHQWFLNMKEKLLALQEIRSPNEQPIKPPTTKILVSKRRQKTGLTGCWDVGFTKQ